MKLNNKNILLISPEPWDHILVSKHHYAIHLGKKGNKIFFLNPPGNLLKIEDTEFENIFNLKYQGFLKGLRFLPGFIQQKQIMKVYTELERLCENKFDIVWSFDNSVFYDFSALPDSVLKICHIVDVNQDFQTKYAAETANICFGVSAPIINRLASYNSNTHFINHGCKSPNEKESKIKLPGTNSIKAFYAGNLDIPYIDWSLFNRVVAKNKDVDFVIAGPWHKGKTKEYLSVFSNVYYTGRLSFEELTNYYSAADILVIIYKADEFPEQLSNAHKMMEYLRSGKMIVATRTMEYEALAAEELILMSKKNQDYPKIFQSAIKDIKKWNSKERMDARKAYAEENTYDKQIERIEQYLK